MSGDAWGACDSYAALSLLFLKRNFSEAQCLPWMVYVLLKPPPFHWAQSQTAVAKSRAVSLHAVAHTGISSLCIKQTRQGCWVGTEVCVSIATGCLAAKVASLLLCSAFVRQCMI